MNLICATWNIRDTKNAKTRTAAGIRNGGIAGGWSCCPR